jgi:hypothetical protein
MFPVDDELSLAGCLHHPADRLIELERNRPAVDAPVNKWAAWFEQRADLYEQIAALDPGLTLDFVADHYRRKAKALLEQHKPSAPWPGASTW